MPANGTWIHKRCLTALLLAESDPNPGPSYQSDKIPMACAKCRNAGKEARAEISALFNTGVLE